MADWVHCNLCFSQPGELNIRFYLTNCGHMYCAKCITAGETCKMCGKEAPATMKLTSKMKPEVEMFFTEPTNIQKKIVQLVNQQQKVLEFQTDHRRRFTGHIRAKMMKEKKVLKENDRVLAGVKEECRRINEENRSLKSAIHQKIQQLQQMEAMRQGRGTPPQHSNRGTKNLYPSPSQGSKQISPGRFTIRPVPMSTKSTTSPMNSCDGMPPPITPSPMKVSPASLGRSVSYRSTAKSLSIPITPGHMTPITPDDKPAHMHSYHLSR